MSTPSNASSICISHVRQAMHRAYARTGRTVLTKMIGYVENSSHLSNACAGVHKFPSNVDGSRGRVAASRDRQDELHTVIHNLGAVA